MINVSAWEAGRGTPSSSAINRWCQEWVEEGKGETSWGSGKHGLGENGMGQWEDWSAGSDQKGTTIYIKWWWMQIYSNVNEIHWCTTPTY